jgi:hypothetical protein
MFTTGLLALVLVLSASVATAQVTGLYYKEVEKDGRIYVFNTPEKYKLWEQSGDMGTAITLIGQGPNGETVVAENETAADLYFFKHNLPGYDRPTPKPPTPPDPNAWYNKVKVGGYVFGDAYYVADHHLPVVDAQDIDSGFWIRRGYLTIDNAFNPQWNARLRFEVNSPGDFNAATAASNSVNTNLNAYVKDAYLSYKHNDAFTGIFGIQPTPTFEVIENFWGYRSVEKTPVDLQRLQGSRDFGLAAKGAFSGNKFKYHLLIGNGGNTTQEVNDGKLSALALGFYPTSNFFIEIYGDNEDRAAGEERDTLQGFLGFQGTWGRAGAQYVKQTRSQTGRADIDIAIASGFLVYKINPRWAAYARYDDTMDPNPGASGIAYLPMVNTAESQLSILGLDWQIAPKINLQPNVEHVTYKSTIPGPDPDDDTLVRLTFYWQF